MQQQPASRGGSQPRADRRLNPRDLELLGHLAAGRSTAQVATAMSLSSNSVRTRIRRVQGKLSVEDRRQVVGRAHTLGLV
jgi:DNA-binding NarL/FixJ family response regulator